jgi:hypothetical protein
MKEATATGSQTATGATTKDDRAVMVYRAAREGHLTQAGKVALGNWVGKVGGQTHRVYFGAPAAKVPPEVREAMAKSRIGVAFGEITAHDLRARPWDRSLRRGAPVQPHPPQELETPSPFDT